MRGRKRKLLLMMLAAALTMTLTAVQVSGRGTSEAAEARGQTENGPVTDMEEQVSSQNGQTEQASGPAEVPDEMPADMPLVALTFDDGPRASTTGRLLDALAEREIPATFFLIGCQIAENEDLIRRMAEQGEQIGIHTWDHVNVTGLSAADFDAQVGRTRAALTELLGEREYWFRPPYGLMDAAAKNHAGSPLVLWSVDPEDWKDRNTERIVAAVTEKVRDGDIILLHDIYESSVDAAIQIADELTARGFCFVTVEQLTELRGWEIQAGEVISSLPAEKKK